MDWKALTMHGQEGETGNRLPSQIRHIQCLKSNEAVHQSLLEIISGGASAESAAWALCRFATLAFILHSLTIKSPRLTVMHG